MLTVKEHKEECDEKDSYTCAYGITYVVFFCTALSCYSENFLNILPVTFSVIVSMHIKQH